ncbi:hypothetical protein NI17_002930 [Thermobifida halotolerans]|uniref:Cell division protein FtsL n=2 Tax=Thermobifida halotolerans TaxID=483545 RepID=A0AA97LXS4_9ACTN|nr:hypothetical protein [Thermobifida halotolerans]UOE20217.1 hypothetical protein NI17_002930 [Thermobifida halotolerans]
MKTHTEEHAPSTRSRSRTTPSRPRVGRGTAAAGGTRGARPHSPAPRMPFVLLVLGLLGGALVTLLMLHAVLAEDTFEIATLQRENRELGQQEQALREKVMEAESPEAIAEAAEELGMRPGEEPRFLDLETGEVTGAEPTRKGE